jgi:hypothetical protein
MKCTPLLLLVSALAGSAAAKENLPDLPGLAFDKLVWNMGAVEMKAAYPQLGDRAPTDSLMWINETASLRTSTRFAGCSYIVGFDVVEPDGIYKEGLDRVDLNLEKGQSTSQCLVQAKAALTRAVGPPVPDLGSRPPPSTSWYTPRTDISLAEHDGGAWILFSRRDSSVRGIIRDGPSRKPF